MQPGDMKLKWVNKIVTAVLFVLLFQISFAQQPCNADIIMNVKGAWKKRSDANIKADKNQAQFFNRLDGISKLFQTAYPDPKGIEAGWYRTMEGNPMINNGPTPYQFSSLYLGWYCNENLHKLMLGTETGTWSNVYINSFGWFMTHQYDELPDKIEGATAFLFPKKIGEWKGFPLYEPSTNTNKCKAILITRNNQLPYKAVTRSQFLKSMKEKIEANKKVQIDVENKMVVRTDAEQEAAKQSGMDNALKYAPPNRIEERKANYLKNYKTDQQRKEENIQRAQKYYDGLIKGIDDAWKNLNEDELKEPAIVDNVSYAFLFKGFTTLEKGGRMIVFVNNDYFNLKLPRYVPQLIVLYWEWDKNAAAQNFKNQLEETFPVDKLKAMIDK